MSSSLFLYHHTTILTLEMKKKATIPLKLLALVPGQIVTIANCVGRATVLRRVGKGLYDLRFKGEEVKGVSRAQIGVYVLGRYRYGCSNATEVNPTVKVRVTVTRHNAGRFHGIAEACGASFFPKSKPEEPIYLIADGEPWDEFRRQLERAGIGYTWLGFLMRRNGEEL